MVAEIFGPDLIVVGLLALIYVIPIVAFFNALSKPSDAFAASGFSKSKWVWAIGLFTVLGSVIGSFVAIRYLVATRPKVNATISEGRAHEQLPQVEIFVNGRIRSRGRIFADVVVVVVIVGLIAGSAVALESKSSSKLSRSVSDCPKASGKVISEWCIAGTANSLPYKMRIYTSKLVPPFVAAKGGTTAFQGQHAIGSDCVHLGNALQGSLVVPVFFSLDQNVKVGPTGGTSPVVFDFSTSGSFYTNPAGIGSSSADIRTQSVVDHEVGNKWTCGTSIFAGESNKTSSKDRFGLVGFFILSGWTQYPWKSYMLKHLELEITLNPPNFYPSDQALYRGGSLPVIMSRVSQVDGPRISINGKGQADIQLLATQFRADKVLKKI